MEREVLDAKLKEIVIDQLGIEESEYHLDANFVRDLGVD